MAAAVQRTDDSFTQQVHNLGEFVGNILNSVGPGSAEDMDELLTDLHRAIEADQVDRVKEVAASGIDLNQKFDGSVNPGHAGITPLALSCALNKHDMAQALLEHGADVNQPFATLNTSALMTSSYHGHIQVVALLIEHGANVQAVDLQQSTALGYAFGGTRDMAVIQLLVQAGIDVNRKNMLGMNSLLLVAGYGSEELVALILDAGADPRSTNDFGHTALHLAVVGKRDLLKKMKKLGSAEAVAADRSLNRRNLDMAMQEWARLHKDSVGGREQDQETLARAAKFMMSLGSQLDEEAAPDEDDREVLKRRVGAVWKHRQDKLARSREKRKSGIWSLLSCGGGKSSKHQQSDDAPSGAKPYDQPADQPQPPVTSEQGDVERLTESFARILRMLVDAGCQIDRAEKTFGMTALDLAMLNGDVESTAVLISAGSDPDHFLKMLALKDLYEAMVTGRKKEVKDLLTYDEDLDVNAPFTRFNVEENSVDEGLTPLSLAVRENDLDTAKLLIKRGARVNEPGPAGRPPLGEAATRGNRKMAEMLLSNGADLEQPVAPFNNGTPVTVAALTRQHDMAAFFIKKGAKVDKPMADGCPSVIRAYEAQDNDMIDTLLMADLQHNFVDRQGFMGTLAAEYQSRDRDTETILAKLGTEAQQFESNVPIAHQEAPPHHTDIHNQNQPPTHPPRQPAPQQQQRPPHRQPQPEPQPQPEVREVVEEVMVVQQQPPEQSPPRDVPRDVPQDVPQDVPHNAPRDVPHNVSRDEPHDIQQPKVIAVERRQSPPKEALAPQAREEDDEEESGSEEEEESEQPPEDGQGPPPLPQGPPPEDEDYLEPRHSSSPTPPQQTTQFTRLTKVTDGNQETVVTKVTKTVTVSQTAVVEELPDDGESEEEDDSSQSEEGGEEFVETEEAPPGAREDINENVSKQQIKQVRTVHYEVRSPPRPPVTSPPRQPAVETDI